MKIKLDENLPASLADKLRQLGHDVDTSADEGLEGRPDSDIWQAAQATQRLLMTQDLDFSDMRRFAPGTHHGLLLVRLRNSTRAELIARISEVFERVGAEDWTHNFVVVTATKVRLRKPRD
jgi:predicted nuclease of predicted toxin-antitoxin system